VHGTLDNVVPTVMSRSLVEHLPAATLWLVPGGHHNELFEFGDHELLRRLVEFAKSGPNSRHHSIAALGPARIRLEHWRVRNSEASCPAVIVVGIPGNGLGVSVRILTLRERYYGIEASAELVLRKISPISLGSRRRGRIFDGLAGVGRLWQSEQHGSAATAGC
jgi:hypothetical protein